MNKTTRQIDLEVSGLCVREMEGEQKRRTIEGHAVVFGVRSINLTPWSSDREVYEIMEPGCITQDLLSRSDVVLTAFHDNTAILGRWRKGRGTLNLSLDERGLRVQCTLADTARADELLSAIERGDIDGMSFAFRADEEDNVNGVTYEKTQERTADNKAVWIRRVKKVTSLYDVTIAGHPAYPQTDVAQREFDEFLDKHMGDHEEESEEKDDDKDDVMDDKDDVKDDIDKPDDEDAADKDDEKDDDRSCGDDDKLKREYEYRRRKLQIGY